MNKKFVITAQISMNKHLQIIYKIVASFLLPCYTNRMKKPKFLTYRKCLQNKHMLQACNAKGMCLFLYTKLLYCYIEKLRRVKK